VGLDHRWIPEDYCDLVSVMTGGDNLPVFVSPELGEGETARHLQGVPVLRRERHPGQERRQDNHGDCCPYAQHSALLRSLAFVDAIAPRDEAVATEIAMAERARRKAAPPRFKVECREHSPLMGPL
jgi:hypothetical protein